MLTREKIEAVVQEVAPKYAIKRVYLFGSYARGDATEQSDCDFRIEGGNFKSLYDIIGLHLDFEDALGKSVDVVESDCIIPSFYDAIKNEEVLVYEKICVSRQA
jgi:predicted nucleotidyltransferase